MARIGLVYLLVSVLLLAMGDTQDAMARDEIDLPPIQRIITSANGSFELVITRPDRLVPRMFPQSVLYRRTVPDGERIQVWDKALNIYIGPRFVVVSDTGIVIFFDEWLRKNHTDYAVQVLGIDGVRYKNYTLEEVITITGLNWPEIVETARYGAWMSKAPTLRDSDCISFEVGGTHLLLRIGEAVLEVHEDED